LNAYVIPFERLGMHDVETVGGKNASLGEMIGSLTKSDMSPLKNSRSALRAGLLRLAIP